MMTKDANRLDCLVGIESRSLTFQFQKNGQKDHLITLDFGYSEISDKYFKHDIPNDAEIEYAINFIEDQLMSKKELLGPKGGMLISDETLIGILRKNQLTGSQFQQQDIESLFSQYARVIMGAPASELGTEIKTEDVAIILILREVVHHMDFKQIRIIPHE